MSAREPVSPGVRATRAERGWDRAQIAPLILDLGCCGVAALRLGDPDYGLPGCGGSAWGLAPKEANVLLVAGRLSTRLVPFVLELHSRLADERWVIACGTCAISGVLFDSVPLSQAIPVDICVPGCPPHPDALWDALAHLPRRRRS